MENLPSDFNIRVELAAERYPKYTWLVHVKDENVFDMLPSSVCAEEGTFTIQKEYPNRVTVYFDLEEGLFKKSLVTTIMINIFCRLNYHYRLSTKGDVDIIHFKRIRSPCRRPVPLLSSVKEYNQNEQNDIVTFTLKSGEQIVVSVDSDSKLKIDFFE